jgi:ABC-type glutathione transport system ATPase component
MNISKLAIYHKSKTLVDINFSIESSLALVGQSGSGKSLTIKALLGVLPNNMELVLEYNCDFMLQRGKSVSFVPQNPFTALSPLTKIESQFFLKQEEMERVLELVGLEKELSKRFPPELSGGQLQRVVIAMAIANNPKLILLDEPTTALDPLTKKNILTLLKKLQKEGGFKMLFVTHDMQSAKDLCDDICVIKDGKVVESGILEQVLQNPKQLYTKTLIEANFANRDFRK